MKETLAYIYFFGKGIYEGDSSMKEILGGKGANLAEIAGLNIPVPPGFTITTEACAKYNETKKFPPGLKENTKKAITRLETILSKKLGDSKNPLLVSVRSGAAVSMPGMMDTILNLGLNDTSVIGLAQSSQNERFAYDAYRRLINMFGNVVYNMNHHDFEQVLTKVKNEYNVALDTELNAEALKKVVFAYKALFKKHAKKDFPQNVHTQLQEAILAVFSSWNNERAITYRKLNKISGLLGTAANVQSMVFGNFGLDSGTGVAFTRDASTGEKVFYGEYLMNAQGEDVVAGIRTPKKIHTLKEQQPKIYSQLVAIKDTLEMHYRDMQDIEFTIEQGTLYILQTRSGKRTGAAAIKIAVDMVKEKLITKEEALLRVDEKLFQQVFHPRIDDKAKKTSPVLAKGINASPGAAVGNIVISSWEAQDSAQKGIKTILVRAQTSPEDIVGMSVVQGILTSTGGMTSHAAVVARGMGTPCIVGCSTLQIKDRSVIIADKEYPVGTVLTLDGSTGEIYDTALPLIEASMDNDIKTFLSYADQIRSGAKRPKNYPSSFNVRANADTPEDALKARNLGAQGVGLCRTEHMFFNEDRIYIFREMILADDQKSRKKALDKLFPLQKKDFEGILTAMKGLPVTIRLLDPPLHEFLPQEAKQQSELASMLNISITEIQHRIQRLHESNPMMGLRGCRLGIIYPEVYEMQIRAIINAEISCLKKGIKVKPEIMIPIVGSYTELARLKELAQFIIKEEEQKNKLSISSKIGTMIEIPRAAITADKIAQYADFFSFGTNDLTQLTYGFSREDTSSFFPNYLDEKILENDPFQILDTTGVGFLVKHATIAGRTTKPDLSIGICGEHGGEPHSINFAYQCGLNYVSCSTLRVPFACLAAAQAVIQSSNQTTS